jgi:hypothetical protein
VYEVGRVFPRYIQRTCLIGESPLGCPRVAYTLHLYNYLLTEAAVKSDGPPPGRGRTLG